MTTMTCKGGRISKTDSLLVVAIDFGTTFSGYAFQFRHDYESDRMNIFANTSWVADGGGLVSWKTPTTLLLNANDTFNSFGYAAEEEYHDLVENDDHYDYHYFRRFKMMLHGKMILSRDVSIEDSGGRQYPAKTVFMHSIKYLNEHFFETLGERGLDIGPRDIQWVLTVPAIWNEPAKQFMREAAVEAGIPDKNLILALEPEAASLFCKYVPAERSEKEGENMKIVPFKIGTRYMVLDLGGGTVDVTVHEVIDENTLKELHIASGGAWGGTTVDKAYTEMLTTIFGENVMKRFKTERRTDMLEFQRDFEMKKRQVREKVSQSGTSRPLVISIPAALSDFVQEMKGLTLKEAVQNSPFADKIGIKPGNKLAYSRELLENLFDKPKTSIIDHVRKIMDSQTNAGSISAILMVGGFSTSKIIVDSVKEAFPGIRVVVPPDPGLAVVKGAVLYGHAPLTIASRVCKFTYGVAVYDDFKENVHPESKKFTHGKEVLCKDIFSKFVESGANVKADEAYRKTYDISKPNAPILIQVFASTEKSPMFTTDDNCSLLGKITVTPPCGGWKPNSQIHIEMKFGTAEFEVQAIDAQNEQTSYSATFDFLK